MHDRSKMTMFHLKQTLFDHSTIIEVAL